MASALLLCALLGAPAAAAPAAADRDAAADSILVLKGERLLLLLRDGRVIRRYRVALGADPIGAKYREGDGRTPEGRYRVDGRNTQSGFHRSLRISYPNAADRALAAELGVRPGGDIMIHGLSRKGRLAGREHVRWDWTDGCIAVTDAEIEEIWSLVRNGTAVEIRP
jgi:murein L,D-transpeptidase YafK